MINARRAAIEGFARHPSAEHLSQLLKLWSSTPLEDTELVHAIRVALRDQFLAPQDADGLKASNRWQSLKFENSGDALLRSGVFAYASKIATEKRDDAEKLADVSLGAKTPEAAEFLVGHLGRTNFATPRAGEYLRHAVLYLAPERLPVLAALLTPEGRAPARPTSTGEASPAKAAATEDQGRAGAHPSELPLAQRLALADNLTQAYRQRGLPLSDALTDWTQHTMLDALASSDDALLKRGVEAVRDVKLDAKLDPLAKIVRDDKRDGALRLAALEATANLPESRDLLVTVLGDPRHMILRKRAAELLAQGGHTDAVLAALPNAPQELMLSFLGALAKTDAGCIALLDTIEAGKASPRLLLNKAAAGPLTSRPQPLRDRAAALTKDLPPEDARLDAVIAERAAAFGKAQPDATHGAQVFQQNCAICHRFHNAGGNVGPALDGVAARGPARLIEDILDPNRNVDPAFRQAIIETTDGEFLMGANRGDQGNSLILADATGKDITVPKNRIKKQTASLLSLMPPVFETAIQPGDFNDLLAFLLSPAPAP
jgi:putative heme-binding domain-containing protein